MPRFREAMDLTAEELRAALNYDPETGDFTWRESRKGAKAGAKAGCLKPTGYIEIKIDGFNILAHRAAWLYVHGTLPASMIDHANQTRTDNRIANLRLADHAQNQWNSDRKLNRGITQKRETSYEVKIRHRGVRRHIGTFKTLAEARAARDLAALALRGEFFPSRGL